MDSFTRKHQACCGEVKTHSSFVAWGQVVTLLGPSCPQTAALITALPPTHAPSVPQHGDL